MNQSGRTRRLPTLFVNMDSRLQMIIIGTLVGLCSGLAAVVLNIGLEYFSHLTRHIRHPWLILMLPGGGLVVTVFLLKYVIRDFGGHGVPEVIHSVSIRGGDLKLRSSFSRLLGSLITIASGGSAGPEAPVVISGAAIGSNISGYLRSNEKIRVAVTGSGAAAAIAAIFNAPVTGFIFTMEVILGEWTAGSMLPVAISSVTGTIVSRLLKGNQIPFVHREFEVNISDILATVGLAVALAGVSLGFIRLMKWTGKNLSGLLRNHLVRALAGGLVVGGIVLAYPQVRGEGYRLVRQLIAGEYSASLLMIMILILMKILATSLTLGSGGAGGIFAPALVLGSLTGLLYFQLLVTVLPEVSFTGAALFSLVGMAGMLSGTLQAPLTGIFLIVEITGGYDAILPLLLVSFLCTTMVRLGEEHSIYLQELAEKGELLRPRTDGRILSELRTAELLETDLRPLYPEMPLRALVPRIVDSHRNYFPVLRREDDRFLGMVYFNDIKPYLFDSFFLNSLIVEEVMRTDLPRVSISDSVGRILQTLDRTGAWSLPVVQEGRFLGLISRATILDHYRRELKAQTDT